MNASPNGFSIETRQHNLMRLEQETFDLLIIGGGITGAGIANEAARHGYKVALVEQGDFAGGTSSKSSKLIHGGLRYMATLKFGLIREACRQRSELLDVAPHLVWKLPFVLPIYQDGPRSLWQLQIAMWLYDALANFHNRRLLGGNKQQWPTHQMWTAQEAATHEPLLTSQRLRGAVHYYDCGTDDARLTLLTLLDASRRGTVLANYAKVVGLLRSNHRVSGVQLQDQQNEREIEVRARVVIGAVGPWTDHILQLAQKSMPGWLVPTKGVHLIVRREQLPCQAALTFNSPRDGRFMFLIPWGNRVIIGTTDTTYRGDLNNIFASSEDVTYMLEAVQRAFPSAGLNDDDVISTYAGLRPLIKKNGKDSSYLRLFENERRSRQHRIGEVIPGLIMIAGGKFTIHRAMAQDAVNEVTRILGREHHRFPAEFRPNKQNYLPGGNVEDWNNYQAQQQAAIATATGLSDQVAGHLLATYGTEVDRVLLLLAESPMLAERIIPDLPVIKAQVVYAIRYEMALALVDILDHRLHILTRAVDQGLEAAETVANLMATELGWTSEERTAQIVAYRRAVTASRRWRDE